MHRHTAAAIILLASTLVRVRVTADVCENVWPDDHCADQEERFQSCETNPGYFKIMCAKTCNSCDLAYNGPTCTDLHIMCPTWLIHGCEKSAGVAVNCAKSCDACYKLDANACFNYQPDDQCERMKKNLGGCNDLLNQYCRKTCGQCESDDKPKQDVCENVWPDDYCADQKGKCESFPGYYKIMCAKICNSCDIAYNGPTCANLARSDDQCDSWADRGECDINPNYMSVNCAKSCETCYKLDANACYNHYVDDTCEAKKIKEGGCNDELNQRCRKTCGQCE